MWKGEKGCFKTELRGSIGVAILIFVQLYGIKGFQNDRCPGCLVGGEQSSE